MSLILLPASAQEQDTLTGDDGFRLIAHVLGETCVPETPERVVALDITIAELLPIIDNPPVAISELVFTT